MISNYYSYEEKKLFLEFESKLVFSKNFRRLNGKTQLFSSQKGDHFRNRMVHTEEVRVIALRIAQLINEKINCELIDLNLVSCIAISHDFGHTPFGHIGERTLQDILTKKDKLGNIFGKGNYDSAFFKHNINSMRLLVQEFGENIPWQILDGVLKHSKLSYNDKDSFDVSYMLPKTNYDKIYYKYIGTTSALTLEGQLVAIADEIAQRYGDFEDTFRARNINSLKKILEKISADFYFEKGCIKYIDELLNRLINSVVEQSVSNIKSLNLDNGESIRDHLSKKAIIEFDNIGLELNNEIENFIKECIFSIDELRQEDEKNKHIIRQLFKAFYNDCYQMKGQYYLDFIQNMQEYIKKIEIDSNENDYVKTKYNDVFYNEFFDLVSKTPKIKNFKNFICCLKGIEQDDNPPECVKKVYNKYLEQICFYIASMTDQYAVKSYQYLYGIK